MFSLDLSSTPSVELPIRHVRSKLPWLVFDWELELERVRESQLCYSDSHCL